MQRFVLTAVLATVLGCAQGQAQQSLDDAAILSLVVGKSAVFDDYSIATYSQDGAYSYVAANNLHFRGKYSISGGKLCFAIEGGQKRCDLVGADAQSPYLVTPTGQSHRFSVHAAAPPQRIAKLCGLEVAYAVQPPASDVPKSLADFSGTWLGTWDYGMCGALIVESVKPDGTVSAIYVNGDFGQPPSIKAGSMRFPARIVGKTLTDGGTQTRFDAVMANPNEVTVTRIGPPGQGRGRFRRADGR